jgi:hypothetical protein
MRPLVLYFAGFFMVLASPLAAQTAGGTVTCAKTQTVDAGGAPYKYIGTYAFVAPTDCSGPLPFAARLDRSPRN